MATTATTEVVTAARRKVITAASRNLPLDRLIIISPRQYGYQTDYLKYVEYLPEWYDLVFICLDQGERRFPAEKAVIKYVRCPNRSLAYPFFFLYAYLYTLFHQGKVMLSNFKGCRWFKRLMPWRKMAVNIRTVSVDADKDKARSINARILKDATPFDRIIMISKGGAEQLHLPMHKVDIVGLGADEISSAVKSYDKLHLLYVGTLNNRHIPDTVEGFHKYLLESGDNTATYDIVGDGEELQEIKDYVNENKLSDRVFIHGRKPYDQLKPFFDKCNVGVAYVPITEGYSYQPPTKTFEYMLSGLYTIATANPVHKETIRPQSGCLIQDTPQSFCSALYSIYAERSSINDSEIREGGRNFLWHTIVSMELINALEQL